MITALEARNKVNNNNIKVIVEKISEDIELNANAGKTEIVRYGLIFDFNVTIINTVSDIFKEAGYDVSKTRILWTVVGLKIKW